MSTTETREEVAALARVLDPPAYNALTDRTTVQQVRTRARRQMVAEEHAAAALAAGWRPPPTCNVCDHSRHVHENLPADHQYVPRGSS